MKVSRASFYRRMKRKLKGQPELDYDDEDLDNIKKKIKKYRYMKSQNAYAMYNKPNNQYEFVTTQDHKCV